MQFLILTPDGVGSTILQRLITLTYYLEDIKIRNTHELTNGLELDDNNVLSKNFEHRYSQTLPSIEYFLTNCNKDYKYVCRLAKYHLDNRKDPEKDQKKFYNYLNKEFQNKIKCVRKNIFEYALSWSIRKESGILNVFDRNDKIEVSKVKKVNEDFFLQKCNEYVAYLEWIDNNFTDTITIAYEDLVINTDAVLQQLTGYADTYPNNFNENLSTLIKNEYEYVNFGKCKTITD